MTEDDYNLGKLFLCEEYHEKTFEFENLLSINLFCSRMSTTDHDLTGQIVWPASQLLSWFIIQNKELFLNKKSIELGAGCGLAGFVSSRYCSEVAITDGNEIVMRLLDKNVENIQSKYSSCKIISRQLIWGIPTEVERIYQQPSQYPDFIFGADVILWPNFISPLFFTISLLLRRNLTKSAICYISYIERATSNTSLIYDECKKLNLDIKVIPVEDFVPFNVLQYREFVNLKKYLFKITIGDSCNDVIINDESYESSFNKTAAPC